MVQPREHPTLGRLDRLKAAGFPWEISAPETCYHGAAALTGTHNREVFGGCEAERGGDGWAGGKGADLGCLALACSPRRGIAILRRFSAGQPSASRQMTEAMPHIYGLHRSFLIKWQRLVFISFATTTSAWV